MRVLVVEDERVLARHVAGGLRDQGMAVDVCFDGSKALELLGLNAYEVMILDRDLPQVSGDEVCRALAEHGEAPLVLMLTASAGIEDRLSGLSLGADDYLGKPSGAAWPWRRWSGSGFRIGCGTGPGSFPAASGNGSRSRAIAGEPAVVLADEPTGNLDQATGADILSLLRRLNSEGTTLIVVTHDPQVAAAMRRRIEIRDGRIINDLVSDSHDEGA